jgi:DNA-binding NtrC family response regulator
LRSVFPDPVLIVDPDTAHAQGLSRALRSLGAGRVHVTSRIASAQCLPVGARLLIVDAELLSATNPCLVAQLRQLPQPFTLLAMSDHAERCQIADLILRGTDGYLEKPVADCELALVLNQVLDLRAKCARFATTLVGHIGLKEAQDELRDAMNTEALMRTAGNRRAAARLLGVDRAYVRRLARAVEDRSATTTFVDIALLSQVSGTKIPD